MDVASFLKVMASQNDGADQKQNVIRKKEKKERVTRPWPMTNPDAEFMYTPN